jgi:UDP-glucose 4-epimerase
MPKHLVTGGAGFIGSHLTAALLDRGDDVVVLDDLSGGSRTRVPRGVELVVMSAADEAAVSRLFKSHRFDGVFHLAAFAAEGISHAVKSLNYTANVIGSVNIINAALRANVDFIGYASSVAVYGHGRTPMREADVPTPADSYGNAKLAVERELAITMRMQGLPYFAFRMHNVYGEWQNMRDPYRNAVAIFLNQILRGEPITVYGDGGQIRAFTYVGDIVGTFLAAADQPTSWGQVYNVGSSTTSTVLKLAELVRSTMDAPEHPITHLPARDEVRVAYTDSSHARSVLGPWPETTLTEGIARTAAWARDQGPAELASTVRIEVPQPQRADWVGWVTARLDSTQDGHQAVREGAA